MAGLRSLYQQLMLVPVFQPEEGFDELVGLSEGLPQIFGDPKLKRFRSTFVRSRAVPDTYPVLCVVLIQDNERRTAQFQEGEFAGGKVQPDPGEILSMVGGDVEEVVFDVGEDELEENYII